MMNTFETGDLARVITDRPSGARLNTGDTVTIVRHPTSDTWEVRGEGGYLWWVGDDEIEPLGPAKVSVEEHARYIVANQDLARRLETARSEITRLRQLLRDIRDLANDGDG